jgi:multicomponent Na+:H+ antiporter subunit B
MPPVELLLMLLLLATVIVVARLKDLFAAAMLTGIASLLAAGLFVLMDAVDVAFTEAAVGAGVSTVLFLGALSLTSRREKQERTRILPVLIVVATGAALIYGTWDMPAYGDPDAVIHHHLAPELIAETEKKIHIPNIVTAILASFRGYDTFGEVVVIFTAGVGVALLLGGLGLRRRNADGEEES